MNPIIKGILFVVAIILIAFLSGCEKSEIAEWVDRQSVFFEPGNEETYLYSNHHPDSTYYPEDHGFDFPFDGRRVPSEYTFADGSDYAHWFEGEQIFISTGRKPTGVKYYSHVGSNVQYLEPVYTYFNRDVFTVERLHPNGYFIFEYDWID